MILEIGIERPTSNVQRPTPNREGEDMANETRRYDLGDRLLEYSASVIRWVEEMADKDILREYQDGKQECRTRKPA